MRGFTNLGQLIQYAGSVSIVGASAFFSSCAPQQVQKKLDTQLSLQGHSYSREINAQSPFKKIKLSWAEASELMKERNVKYRKSILDKEQAESEEGVVKSFTNELRKNLGETVLTTFSPSEIASVIKSPIAAVPKQFESLTNLKNVSHSMTTQEWSRVSLAISAETSSREEKVKLHKLFREYHLLNEKNKVISKYEKELEVKELLPEHKPLIKPFEKNVASYKKQREAWLNRVRDFFDAEYYDVEFKNQQKSMPFYRTVNDPKFGDHNRWMLLDHSTDLVKELKADHKKAKPELPGLGMIKSSLGVDQLKASAQKMDLIVNQSKEQEFMRKEVRGMLKNWRELKVLQESIKAKELELAKIDKLSAKEFTLANQVYDLKMKELNLASQFWVKDESCWKSLASN